MTYEELKSFRKYMSAYDYGMAQMWLDRIEGLDSPSAIATAEGVLERTYITPARVKKAAAEAAEEAASFAALDSSLLATANELEAELAAIETAVERPTRTWWDYIKQFLGL